MLRAWTRHWIQWVSPDCPERIVTEPRLPEATSASRIGAGVQLSGGTGIHSNDYHHVPFVQD